VKQSLATILCCGALAIGVASSAAAEGFAVELKPRPAAPLPGQPAAWPIHDPERQAEARKAFIARIGWLAKEEGPAVEREMAAIAAELGALAQFLDATPIPSAPFNVSPPLLRPDGTRYSDQGIMSGMDPKAIWNAEQRQAYLEKLRLRNEKNRARRWLIDAGGDCRMFHSRFEAALQTLVRGGKLAATTAEAAVAATKRKPRPRSRESADSASAGK